MYVFVYNMFGGSVASVWFLSLISWISWVSELNLVKKESVFTRWWFQCFFMFIPIWGNNPIWLIFSKKEARLPALRFVTEHEQSLVLRRWQCSPGSDHWRHWRCPQLAANFGIVKRRVQQLEEALRPCPTRRNPSEATTVETNIPYWPYPVY